MGYLMALPKLIEGGVDIYDKVQAGREKSKTQDFLRDNPDWASSPEKMSQLVSISPSIGAALIDRVKPIQDAESRLASARLKSEKMAWDTGYEEYQRALQESMEQEAPEGGMGAPGTVLGNYAKAETAANDAYQRMRLRVKDRLGEDFADGMGLVWDLKEYRKRSNSYNKLLNSHRLPYDAIDPVSGRLGTVHMTDEEFAETTQRLQGKVQFQKQGTSAAATSAQNQEVIEFKTNEGRFKQQVRKTPQGLQPVGAPVRISDRAVEGDSVAAQHENAIQTIGPRLAKGELVSPGEFTAYNSAYRFATQPQLITETGADGKQVSRWQQPQPLDSRLFPAPEQAQQTEGGWRFTPGQQPAAGGGAGGAGATLDAQSGGKVAGVKGMAYQDAVKAASLNMAARRLPEIERMLFDDKGNPKFWDQLAGSFNIPGTEGRRLQQKIKLVVENNLRANTGAAAPKEEVDRFMEMLAPVTGDSKESIQDKLLAMREWLRDSYSNMGIEPPKDISSYLRGERGEAGSGVPAGLPKGAKVQTGAFKSPSGKTFTIVPE